MSLKAIRLLKTCDEINLARQLLYKIYIQEMKWSFKPENPTKFHIQQSSDGKNMLCDAFDHEAVWGGFYTGDSLVATCRVLTRENSLGKLDLELYNTKRFPSLSKIYTPCIEFQRFAVEKEHRGSGKISPLLVLFVLEYAMVRKTGVCCAAPLRALPFYSFKIGFETLHTNFYYGEGKDEKASFVMFCPCDKVVDAIQAAKNLLVSANHA